MWTSPPYASRSDVNPTITPPVAATLGVGNDKHDPGSGFTSTYVANSFTALRNTNICVLTTTAVLGTISLPEYQSCGR